MAAAAASRCRVTFTPGQSRVGVSPKQVDQVVLSRNTGRYIKKRSARHGLGETHLSFAGMAKGESRLHNQKASQKLSSTRLPKVAERRLECLPLQKTSFHLPPAKETTIPFPCLFV